MVEGLGDLRTKRVRRQRCVSLGRSFAQGPSTKRRSRAATSEPVTGVKSDTNLLANPSHKVHHQALQTRVASKTRERR